MNAFILIALTVILIFLICCSAFFSASETAVFSLNATQLQQIRKSGPAGEKLMRLLEEPTSLLSTILIGNTVVNVLIAVLGYAIINEIPALREYSAFISVVVMTAILLIFGEITPKRLSVRYPVALSLRFAGPLSVCTVLFTPLRKILDFASVRFKQYLKPERKSLSDDELLTAVELGTEEGVIDSDEKSMVDGILRLSGMCAADVMTPRVDFEGIDLDEDPSTYLDIAKESPFHYLPVYRGTPDAIEGFLDVAAFIISTDHNFESALREPYFVPETAALDDILIVLEQSHRHIICVVDEYGGTAGLITRGDILEIITGVLPVQAAGLEEETPIAKSGENTWIIDGDTSLDEINHELDLELEAEGVDRISGWVVAQAGRFLREGDSVEAQGCRVEIRSRRKFRIYSVLLEILPKKAEEDDDANGDGDDENDGGSSDADGKDDDDVSDKFAGEEE